MPNVSSKAGHVPERSCVLCKEKKTKPELLRFIVMSGDYVIDYRQRLTGRGFYLCNGNECIAGLEKWIAKRAIRRRKNGGKDKCPIYPL